MINSFKKGLILGYFDWKQANSGRSFGAFALPINSAIIVIALTLISQSNFVYIASSVLAWLVVTKSVSEAMVILSQLRVTFDITGYSRVLLYGIFLSRNILTGFYYIAGLIFASLFFKEDVLAIVNMLIGVIILSIFLIPILVTVAEITLRFEMMKMAINNLMMLSLITSPITKMDIKEKVGGGLFIYWDSINPLTNAMYIIQDIANVVDTDIERIITILTFLLASIIANLFLKSFSKGWV